MTYNLLTMESMAPDTVTPALAQCLQVPVQEVDVADEAGDQDQRNWDALVLCDMARLRGDVSTSLDIYIQEAMQPQPSERELASAFARAAEAVVLFPAEEAPPSAYWLATEEGLVGRPVRRADSRGHRRSARQGAGPRGGRGLGTRLPLPW